MKESRVITLGTTALLGGLLFLTLPLRVCTSLSLSEYTQCLVMKNTVKVWFDAVLLLLQFA